MNIAEIRQQFPQYEDVSDGELVRGLHKKFYADMPYPQFLRNIDFSVKVDPTKDMSGGQKFAAGMGKAVYDAGRGIKQIVSDNTPTLSSLITGDKSAVQKEVDEARELDKPLMKTGAGIAGNIAGNAAMFAPAAFVPGANTYAGAALTGATMGAIQPTAENESRASNAALGGVMGVGGQALGNAIGRAIKPVASRLGPEEEALARSAAREGIPLTAGQRTGSRPLQVAESVMENLPLTSGPQLAGREAQQRAFTAAALRRAGMTGDSAAAAPLLAQKTAVGGELGAIAQRNAIDFNQGVLNKLTAIVDDASKHLPPDAAQKVAGTVDKVLAQVDQAGKLSGTNYQGWREPLRGLATNTETGRYFGQIRKALDEAFSGQLSGAEAQAFKESSRKYANVKTIIDAMGGAGNLPAKGQVAPAQLGAALARAMGREGKALGRGDLNELARIGQVFVKDQVPNSGTAQRQMIQALLTGGGGATVGGGTAMALGKDPLEGAAYGAGIGASALLAPRIAQMLMNSPAGQSYLSKGAVDLSPAARKLITDALRTGAIASTPQLMAQ